MINLQKIINKHVEEFEYNGENDVFGKEATDNNKGSLEVFANAIIKEMKDSISLGATRIILEKSEMNEEDYQDIKEKKTATIRREDTDNEYIQFTTINLGDM